MLKLAPRYVPKSLPKSLPRFVHTLLVLSLLLPLAHGMAGASPSSSPSGSFKSGFSSQRSSSSSSSSKGSFGSFGKRPSSQAGEPSKARGGGFGSFGGAAPSDARRSDSALSRKLDRDAAAARALRTLDERRAAQAARNAPRDVPPMRRDDPRQADNPPPAYGNNNGYGYGNNNNNGRTPPSGGDLGRVIAGAVIANAAANAAAHAANNANSHGQRNETPMPAPSWNGGVGSVDGPVAHAGGAPAQPKQGGGSAFGTVAVLLVLALAGWLAWKWIMRARARRAADKPNYSFERN